MPGSGEAVSDAGSSPARARLQRRRRRGRGGRRGRLPRKEDAAAGPVHDDAGDSGDEALAAMQGREAARLLDNDEAAAEGGELEAFLDGEEAEEWQPGAAAEASAAAAPREEERSGRQRELRRRREKKGRAVRTACWFMRGTGQLRRKPDDTADSNDLAGRRVEVDGLLPSIQMRAREQGGA